MGCLCERHRKKRGITSVAVNKKNIQLYYLILFILNLNIFYVHTVYTYRTVHLYDNTYHTTTLVPIIDKKKFSQIEKMNNLDNNLKIFSESLRNGATTAKRTPPPSI